MLTEEEIWTAIRQSSIRAPVTRDDMVRVAKWARDQMMPTWFSVADAHPRAVSEDEEIVLARGKDGTNRLVRVEHVTSELYDYWREAIPGIDWPLEGESDDHD